MRPLCFKQSPLGEHWRIRVNINMASFAAGTILQQAAGQRGQFHDYVASSKTAERFETRGAKRRAPGRLAPDRQVRHSRKNPDLLVPPISSSYSGCSKLVL